MSERAVDAFAEAGLTLGFYGFLHFALFFLFLLLKLVADQFENSHLRAVTHANAAVDDPRVAAGTIGELWARFH